jgi:NADH-quinone oxidoreductase subunit N
VSVPPFSVEIATACLLVAVLLADMLGRHGTGSIWVVFISGILVVLGIAVAARGEGVFINGAYAADGLSWISKIVLVIGAGLTGGISLRSLPIRQKYHGAYAALLLGALLGMMVLVSTKDLLTLYVGLETSAISLYGLASIAKADDRSLEAGIKYLVTGALSSGILLYGIALIYAGTGATTLDAIRAAAAAAPAGVKGSLAGTLLPVGTILILLGVGFKLSMVPMHVWTPDVYQGAPTPVAAFISVVSKSAGFVFAIRLFTYAFADLRQIWEPVVMVCAVLTMTVGNLAAIPQRSAKRLLAYSTISQAGYLLVGFLGSPSTGTSAVVFYLFVYTVTNAAAFAAVVAFYSATGSDDLEDYAGLARREPVLALAFTLALLSLAGIPPMGGFIGKFYLFAAAMEKGYLWLVIVASLNSVVSLFYYLLVLRRMYIAPPGVQAARLSIPLPVKAVLLLTSVGIFWLGILPGSLMRVIGDVSARVFPGF